MRTNLAVHCTGNSPGHSLRQPRLDCTLAIIALCISIYNVGLHKPRECLELDQWYLSEKTTCNFKLFACYTHELLYIFLDFQVSEMLYKGSKFLL